MNFSFENQGTNTYLVYAIEETDSVDTMSLGMLTNNKILGLAPAFFTQMDAMKYIKYNISAHVSVRQFFSGPVNKKRLIGVFTGIVDAMLSAEDYMIDINSISLDLDYIFADVTTCETILICLPIENYQQNAVDLSTFFKNIMFSTQFDQTENCDHVAKIINYLNSTPVFSLVEFKSILEEISKEQVSNPVSRPQPVVTQPKVTVQAESQQKVKTEVQKTVGAPQPIIKSEPIQVPPMHNEKDTVTGSSNIVQQNVVNSEPEKKISMLDLLMHYNKENAAAYKAQKAAQKTAKVSAPPKSSKTVAKPSTPNASFVVPGQSDQMPKTGFAVPGQPTPASNSSFEVPGQLATTPTPSKESVPNKGVQPVVPQKATQTTPVVTPAYQTPVMPTGQSASFGETVVLNAGNIGETTVLNGGMMMQAAPLKPYLIRTKNNERIELNKPVFRIGKEKSYVDYFISDNTAISRSHANVISRDGEYYVVDTNSTNHTYVDNIMLQSNVETKIIDGAKLRFANEDFEFKLM